MYKEPRIAMNLRLPPELHQRLGEVARVNRRSMTAEIVHRLEQSVRDDERRERRRKDCLPGDHP